MQNDNFTAIKRRVSHEVDIGGVRIGGSSAIAIQSMCNTRTEDVLSTTEQINRLAAEGCDIVRCAVPTMEAARAISGIKERISVPLVADIHFDYKLAIAAIENGADKIRINPGNIGGEEKVRAVVEAASSRGIPIRVGVNSGSLEKKYLEKYGKVTPEGLVESAMSQVHLLEKMDFHNIVISIKSSDVMTSVRAHELISRMTDHPLHVGITETGSLNRGNIKSAVGIGIILHEGIGDTIRVSLTADPVEEVRSAKQILRSLGLIRSGIEVVSCPTCGRTRIDLIGLEAGVEELVKDYSDLDLKIAVMGCAVNGPGEAREADIGIAGGLSEGLIFKKGEIIKKVPENELLAELKVQLDSFRLKNA